MQDLNLKKHFPADAEARTLEDALCLVFLEFQLASLAAKSDDDKMINALQKSWGKMTDAARTEALKLNYGEREKTLLHRALNGEFKAFFFFFLANSKPCRQHPSRH